MDGEKVLFTCKVEGKPTPQVAWYHNNKPIRESKEVTIFQDTEGVCYLGLSEVFPEDAGEFTCTAINRLGEAVCAASLVVEGIIVYTVNRTFLKTVMFNKNISFSIRICS